MAIFRQQSLPSAIWLRLPLNSPCLAKLPRFHHERSLLDRLTVQPDTSPLQATLADTRALPRGGKPIPRLLYSDPALNEQISSTPPTFMRLHSRSLIQFENV